MNLGGANCCNYSAITTSSMFFFQVQTLGIRTRNDPGTGTSQKSPIFIKTLVIWQIQTNSALSWFSWNGRCQYMSIYVNICQYMSIYVNICQYMSMYVNVCQCMSIFHEWNIMCNSLSLPSGKLTFCYGKSPCYERVNHGKSTILYFYGHLQSQAVRLL